MDELIQSRDYIDIELASLMLNAIKYNAPLWIFENLLSRGATFEYVHLHALILNKNLTLLVELESLGLDIHSTSNKGHNGVQAAITTMDAHQIFDYLLERNVSVSNTIDGKDYLEIALSPKWQNPGTCHYVIGLITTGNIVIEQKHVILLGQLQSKDKASYRCILANSANAWII